MNEVFSLHSPLNRTVRQSSHGDKFWMNDCSEYMWQNKEIQMQISSSCVKGIAHPKMKIYYLLQDIGGFNIRV